MAYHLCLCGCGTPVASAGIPARGHHWRIKRREQGVPDEKTCEWCGATYCRTALVNPQSNKHWLKRRFCGEKCRRASRAGESLRGEDHPGWKGDNAARGSGRMRALRMYPDPKPCQVCGTRAERHHIDGNTLNNEPGNIAWLCRQHHIAAEDRMAYRRTVDRTEREREREREHQKRYRLRKKGLLPPYEPKGSEETRRRDREKMRRWRARQRAKETI